MKSGIESPSVFYLQKGGVDALLVQLLFRRISKSESKGPNPRGQEGEGHDEESRTGFAE